MSKVEPMPEAVAARKMIFIRDIVIKNRHYAGKI